MPSYSAAIRHLKRADPVLRRAIERVGPCELDRECDSNRFGTLVDAIIYQQLAYKAAATISGRFRSLYGNGRLPKPDEILRTPRRKLRSVGLSRQKIGYLQDLSRKATSGELALHSLGRMADEAVIENVTRVKGIGQWTGEMFLIFCLRRMNVLPVGDLGLQYGFKHAYGLRTLPSAARMQRIAEPWRPFRTVGTWYLWKLRRLATERK